MWHIYIVQCRDGSYYTGISNDVDARVATHNSGKGAKYTRSRLPVTCVYKEEAIDRSCASKREYQIKQLTHREKHELIKQTCSYTTSQTRTDL
ncbi:MAG: GIY-YIG nuclease family protein [Candidatus Shapirobacteria bacterium]|jgi:putative endonuclease